jgi:ATP-binding cassette subfamily B protein
VAIHHRRPITLERLRDLTGTDRAGASLLGLLRAAEGLGFSARGVKGEYPALAEVPLPAIAHVRGEDGAGHFVVLHRAGRRRVVVADPAHGVERLTRAEFCRRWTGYLLILVPDPLAKPATAGGAPASPWRRFLGLLTPHSLVLGEAFVCALLMTLLGVASSYFVQHLVDSVLVQGESRLLNALGIGMVLVAVFRVLFGVVRQYLVAHVTRKVDLALIAGYSRHLLGLPLRFFETRRVGEILSRVGDAAKVREAIGGTTLTAVVDGTLVLFLVAVLWLYDAPLAAVATAFVPLLLVATLAAQPATRRRTEGSMEAAARLSSHLVEDVSGIETIKAFGAERVRAEEGEERLVALVQDLFGLQKLGIGTGAIGTLATALAGLAVLWYGGHRVIDGALTIGQLLFFSTLLGYLLGPLERLAGVNLKLQEALVAVQRLYEVMDAAPEAPLGAARRRPFPGLRGAINLCGVSFGYGHRGRVLDQVNLRIPAGQTVAILGESGSGKSTLLKLLMGYYDPTEGRVTVDGVDLRDFDKESLRARIGLVSQEPFIFNGTLRENIVLGRPGTTPEEVAEVARVAGLDEFIAELPERFDTVIGERGANLSGGQRQRLAIARALLHRPEILIFDEATSHLDVATEQAIQENLQAASAGKTVVLVAHRLSTVRDASLIYVLRRGRVVEQGTHRELLARGGYYWSLWRAQTQSQAGDDRLTPRAGGPAAQMAAPSWLLTDFETVATPLA